MPGVIQQIMRTVEAVQQPPTLKTLAQVEAEAIIEALRWYEPRAAARVLGIGKTTLYRKRQELGLVPVRVRNGTS